jgi:hypothetical protein
MAATRNRFDGSKDELQSVLSPFVVHSSWLLYPEKANDKCRPDILVDHKLMLTALTKLCANLSFGKKAIESAFQGLREEKQFQEISDPDFGDDWVQTMCRRLHMACRHLAQARLRKPVPKWVLLIDGVGSMSQASGSGGHDRSAGDDESQLTVEGTEGAREAHAEADAQLPETLPGAPEDAFIVHACCTCLQLQ